MGDGAVPLGEGPEKQKGYYEITMTNTKMIGYNYDPRGDPGGDIPAPAAFCCRCGQGIYSWEDYGVRDGKRLCPDCLEEDWDELTSREKFRLLGYETVVRRT